MTMRIPLITTPFATSGDKSSIPVNTQPDGSISMTTGWGQDYQREQGVDPDAKPIDRGTMNWLFNLLTGLSKQWQTEGIPEYISAGDNGGVAIGYARGLFVRYMQAPATTFTTYLCTVDNNTLPPLDSAGEINIGWLDFVAEIEKIGQGGGGTWDSDATLTITLTAADIGNVRDVDMTGYGTLVILSETTDSHEISITRAGDDIWGAYTVVNTSYSSISMGVQGNPIQTHVRAYEFTTIKPSRTQGRSNRLDSRVETWSTQAFPNYWSNTVPEGAPRPGIYSTGAVVMDYGPYDPTTAPILYGLSGRGGRAGVQAHLVPYISTVDNNTTAPVQYTNPADTRDPNDPTRFRPWLRLDWAVKYGVMREVGVPRTAAYRYVDLGTITLGTGEERINEIKYTAPADGFVQISGVANQTTSGTVGQLVADEILRSLSTSTPSVLITTYPVYKGVETVAQFIITNLNQFDISVGSNLNLMYFVS